MSFVPETGTVVSVTVLGALGMMDDNATDWKVDGQTFCATFRTFTDF